MEDVKIGKSKIRFHAKQKKQSLTFLTTQ